MRRCLLTTIGVMVLAMPSVAGATPIEVQGHRGARALRPENTLPAFEYAIEAGADVLELDLVVTKDDRLVIGHDPILNPQICLGPDGKPLGGDVRVRALTLAELQRYDCGTLKHPRFEKQQSVPKTKMPALEELFALLRTSKRPRAKTVGLNIELKSVPAPAELTPPPEVMAKLLLDAIAKEKIGARITIQSFDHRALIEVKKRDPKQRIAALISDNFVDHVALAKNLGAEIISPDQLWISADAIERLHKAGVRVIPWTANSELEWSRLVAMKVDGIITDDPAGLLRYLGR